MKKIFTLILLSTIILLSACSSDKTSGVRSDVYSDGQKLITGVNKSLDNDDTDVPRKLDISFNKFLHDYSIKDKKVTSKKDIDFVKTVGAAYLYYTSYLIDEDDETLNDMFNSMDRLKNKYDLKTD